MSSSSKPPFMAFATDANDMGVLKEFAASRQWEPEHLHQGDIRTAAEFLKDHPSPALLMVEVPSAAEAPALLDALANVCEPGTKVIVIGAVNEYSFYCWLTDIGIVSYLLRPLTLQALEAAYQKSVAPPGGQAGPEKPPGKALAVIGSRGGVGASTLALNLAGLIADLSQKQVALVDADPHDGSLALALDIEPSRGLRDALEKPDRIDSLFIERVMNKPLRNLCVLSAEETLHEPVRAHEGTAGVLMKELREKFDVIVLDVSRHLSPYARQWLMLADHTVLVTEMTLLGLRDTLRLSDVMRETLKIKPPVVVVSRSGLAAKQELQLVDFEKGIGVKVAHRVPFAPELFMPVSAEIAAVKNKTHAAVKPLIALAEQLAPEAMPKPDEQGKKAGGLFKKKS